MFMFSLNDDEGQSRISIKGQVDMFSSLSLNNSDMPICPLKELLVAVIVPPVHTGPEEISS